MEENDLYGKNVLIDQERNLVKEKGSENHSPMIAPKPLPIVQCRPDALNRHAHFYHDPDEKERKRNLEGLNENIQHPLIPYDLKL